MTALNVLEKTDVPEIVQAGNQNDKDAMALFCSLLLLMACVGSELTSLTATYKDRSKKSWQNYLRPNSPRPSSVRTITVRQTL